MVTAQSLDRWQQCKAEQKSQVSRQRIQILAVTVYYPSIFKQFSGIRPR
jgi:hypothetical protein